jgi:hypothetical protein
MHKAHFLQTIVGEAARSAHLIGGAGRGTGGASGVDCRLLFRQLLGACGVNPAVAHFESLG